MSKAKLYYADTDPQEINDLEASNCNVTGIVTTLDLNVTGIVKTSNVYSVGIVTATNGFISVANTTPITISLDGKKLIFSAVGIGSTTFTLA
jgi:hypothetical protein